MLILNRKQTLHQRGQAMVEYVVVLVFGVMVLTVGPGGDVLLDLLGMMNDKYQGYSYAASLSDLPQYDSLGTYLLEETDALDPEVLVDRIGDYSEFPTLATFPDDLMPDSPSDILDGAVSFF